MTDATSDAVEDRLRDVFEAIFSNKVSFHPNLERTDTKHWDSLKHVEFMIAIEKEFGVRLDGADATAMTGIAKTLEIVRGRLA